MVTRILTVLVHGKHPTHMCKIWATLGLPPMNVSGCCCTYHALLQLSFISETLPDAIIELAGCHHRYRYMLSREGEALLKMV